MNVRFVKDKKPTLKEKISVELSFMNAEVQELDEDMKSEFLDKYGVIVDRYAGQIEKLFKKEVKKC